MRDVLSPEGVFWIEALFILVESTLLGGMLGVIGWVIFSA